MPGQQPKTVNATFYVQLEAITSTYGKDAAGEPILQGAKAVRLTQERPGKPKPGAVIAKLTVQMPSGAFLPLRPEAVIVIPDSLLEQVPIEVEAQDPAQDG